MSATFDAATTAAYQAATTAAARAAAIVASLTGTISVKVFNGSNVEMGSGTMAAPWATAVNNGVVIGEVTEFTVGTTATPDADWYIRFQNADVSRWARGSFGLLGSGQDYTWSLPAWTATDTGTIGTAYIIPTGNQAPAFTVAPTSASIAGTGGTIQFTAVDPEGGAVFYTLTTTRAGITINASGLVTVTAAAAGTSGNIVVQASDGILTASATCAVTVAAVGERRWNPGHYIKTQGNDSRTDQQNYWPDIFNTMDRAATFAPMKGAFVTVSWGSFNTTGSTYDWTYLDALFAKADSLGQQLIVAISYKNYSGSVGLICPTDLRSANTYATSTGWITALWRVGVMDRFLAAYQAFATRYSGRSALESVSWSETAPSFATITPPSDFSNAALSTQLQRLTYQTVPMFPSSWVMPCINGLSGQTTQMIHAAYLAGAGFSTPDAVDTKGVRLWRGETVDGEQVPTYGDLRGRTMHEEIASSPVLGGKDDNGPATNIIDWAQANAVTHLSWVTTVLLPGNTWTDIKAAILADPMLHTNYPTG